jgi:hypothetical protein
MTFHQVREKLLAGTHEIVYNSLTTEGKQHTIRANLANTNMFLHQSESDKILVFDVTENAWKDIEVKTIVSMEKVDGL